uniref:Ubiquitin-like domain-containing protein n=1 Tax=Oncorhynchus kisutch TaxID=8019 RepID=A0A8C7G4C7_ONCKI
WNSPEIPSHCTYFQFNFCTQKLGLFIICHVLLRRRSIFPSLFSHIQTVTPIDRKTRTPEQLTHIHNHGKDLPGHRDWIQRGENGDNLETLRLIFTNKQLEDSSVLSSYGIQNQSVIQLVMRVPGGWRH